MRLFRQEIKPLSFIIYKHLCDNGSMSETELFKSLKKIGIKFSKSSLHRSILELVYLELIVEETSQSRPLPDQRGWRGNKYVTMAVL